VYMFVEYIWLDGALPTEQLRSKARYLAIKNVDKVKLELFPDWNFDGSSTYQSTGDKSDLILKPASFFADPIRGQGNYLVLCEVYTADGKPHASNTRAQLRKILELGGEKLEPWLGFEQEYTLFMAQRPLGWPEKGFPKAQGPFYCGVGTEVVFGRELVESHALACVQAGLPLYGINGEVMPAQWEFQVGYRGVDGEDVSALAISDALWISRWLLHRLSEKFGIEVSFVNKPIAGDWNGAGCHTNFSTNKTRDPKLGIKAIEEAIQLLSQKHALHIPLYGAGLRERLTGAHETCSIDQFRSGVADRGSSIRIPLQVKQQGYGYLEDRRPGANCDPYLVAARILATILNIDENQFQLGRQQAIGDQVESHKKHTEIFNGFVAA
jgi:glutamine synthetase